MKTTIDPTSAAYADNRAQMLERVADLAEQHAKALAGGGEKYVARHHARGKLTARERIELLVDPDTPFLELGALAGWGTDFTVGGSIITGIGVVEGVECMIVANDPTVKGGSSNPVTVKKGFRAAQVAEENGLPTINLVESGGADLPTQKDIFIPGGASFRNITRASEDRRPTVALVFGNSTAGGAYIPGMSDYVVMVDGGAKVFLGGPPLVKMATGEESDDETLGGGQKHAEESGLADYLAEDEMDALRMCREVVSHLDWRQEGPPPSFTADEPVHDPEELLGLVSRDLRQPVDVRDVIARVVDGSRFEEFKPRYGSSMVCGWASVHGYPVGILGNNGVIYPESAEKGAHFIQLCNQRDIPLLFLQNITGFVVGKDFEAEGIIKKGSQMINAVTNSTVPHLTVIIGSSYGAGTYGMSGRAYGNRFTFLWPTAKIAVMGPKQIAGVMSMVRRGQAARKGLEFDEEADAEIVRQVEAKQEADSLALVASGAISDDGIIDPRDTRTVLGMCLSVVRNRAVEGAPNYGVFRL